jgi:outer membrane protein assembly factor BamE (lipoprotein component of BamABCDE complex)
MKFGFIVMASVVVLALSGCATSSYSVGKNFASENVSQIVKGKTTSEELIMLLGEPYTKTVLSASDEKWIYMHSEGTTKAQSYIVSMNVKTTGTQKTLDVLISKGVVANFAYTEGPHPYNMQVN